MFEKIHVSVAIRFVFNFAFRYSKYPMCFYQFSGTRRFTENYPVPAKDDHYLVRRISVRPNWSGQELLSLLQSGESKPLPFHAKLVAGEGFVNTLWGNMIFDTFGGFENMAEAPRVSAASSDQARLSLSALSDNTGIADV